MDIASVFVDTGVFIGLLNEQDQWHEICKTVFQDLENKNIKFITTKLIIAEVGNGLSKRKYELRGFFEEISERMAVLSISEDLWVKAIKKYCDYADKTWGLTDCYSFELMKSLNLNLVVSTDMDFVQAGFINLLTSYKKVF